MALQETPAAANTDVVSLQVSLPQMLDIALGTPEVGAVNLNILHNFLHILLHQINLQGTKVEYRGENADRIKTMIMSLKPGPALHLQEYSITDGTGKEWQRIQDAGGVEIDILATDAELSTKGNMKITKGTKRQIGPETDSEAQTVIFVEPVVNGSTPTALAFQQLEQSVKQLQQQFQALEELSTTAEVIERLKGKITDPITDIWQLINMQKRLDASEQGIDKLTTIVQDVIKSDTGIDTSADNSLFSKRLDAFDSRVSEIEQKLIDLQTINSNGLKEDTSPADGKLTDVTLAETAKSSVSPSEKKETIPKEVNKTITNKIDDRHDTGIAETQKDVAALKTDVALIRQELQHLKGESGPREKEISLPVKERTAAAEPAKDRRKIAKESDTTNLEQCLEAVKNVETAHDNVLQSITTRIETLEMDVSSLLEKMDSVPVPGSTADNDINDLVTKIQGIQTDMEKLGQTADKLLDNNENQETHLNSLLEQVELLKAIKADKEDLEDALADKADAQAVNRKVSHDQFNAACDDLTRGLEEAIDKLSKQESIWQQALDEVQNEIASKVDKMEMTPLKDFINDRLKTLQEKLKSLTEARREIEAAGTKKILRDVQCISCDKDVVMKMEEIGKFHLSPLPCTTSIKPYLTYKLDQIRKQQKKLPYSRNMIQFETAIQEETKKIKTAKEEAPAKTPRDQLCNRYCGGSHTVTTPEQRVMRVGNFLSQWGPQVVQLNEGMIRGKDDRMYHGRLLPSKDLLCESFCWKNQANEEICTQERMPSVPAVLRKSTQSRRSSGGSQKQISKKQSRELSMAELILTPIVDAQQMIPSQENGRAMTPSTEHQDEIILYKTNEITGNE